MRRNTRVPAVGKMQLDELITQEQEARASRGESPPRAAEVQFACTAHLESGLRVYYEDGLIVMICRACDTIKGQVEVAEQGRVWIEGFKH